MLREKQMTTVQQCRHEAKITFYDKNVHDKSSVHMRKSQQFTTGFFSRMQQKTGQIVQNVQNFISSLSDGTTIFNQVKE